jgi:hypothetical protein
MEGLDAMLRRLGRLGSRFPVATQTGMMDGAQHMRAFMTNTYLSGTRLKIRSGRLKGSWSVIPLGQGRIGAAIITKVEYAPIHEFGFTGSQHVKEHMRAVPDPERSAKEAKKEKKRIARLGTRGKMLARTEQKARAQALRDPGQRTYRNARPLRETKLLERRARGIQGGVADDVSQALRDRAAASGGGMVLVRAHERWMRIRPKYYARDTLRNDGHQACLIAIGRIRKEALSAK